MTSDWIWPAYLAVGLGGLLWLAGNVVWLIVRAFWGPSR